MGGRAAASPEQVPGPVQQPWWRPGVLVAVIVSVVVTAVTWGWYAFADGGCGSPGAKFACLMETLVAAASAAVLGPVLLWLAYRRAGVRRPLLSTAVAVAVASCLSVLPVLLEQVAVLSAVSSVPGLGRYPAPGVGLVLALAVLAGGLALQGPRRLRRSVGAAAALVLLLAAVWATAAPAERAADGLVLDRARVPLLLPGAGWQPYGPFVSAGGDLAYDAVPVGWAGYGFEGVAVDVRVSTERFGDTCGFRACTDVGDVRVEERDPSDPTGATTAWRVVDGYLVSVSDRGDRGPEVDPVVLLLGMTVVDREEFLDRRFTDR